MKRLFHILMFFFIFLFFWNTGIENRTEAEDAYEYALLAEVENHEWLYHPHHLLFGVVARGGFRLAQSLGYSGRAHELLILLSSLSAAGAIFLFFQFCYRRYSMRPVSSLFSAGFLALSYGFWRYSCEAEVVMFASFLVLLAAYLATKSNPGIKQVCGAGIVAGLSILFHVLNVIPVLIALPLFYILKKQFRFAALHVVLVSVLVGSTYALVYSLAGDQAFAKGIPSLADRLGLAFIVKGMIGLGQCIVTGNFLFGFEEFSGKMIDLFPSRMLNEEVFTGSRMPRPQVWFSVVTVSLLFLSIFCGLYRAVIFWKHAIKKKHSQALSMIGGWQTVTVVGLWFFSYAIAILLLEPGNPEVWVMGLIPFWLLVCGLLIAPIARANELWVVLLMLFFLGLHNYVGGISILKNPGTDYNQQKAAWILEHAGPDDLIITAENPVFLRYLKYYAESDVVDLNIVVKAELEFLLENAQGVYILNDVFDYPPSMRIRFPEAAKKVDAYAVELKPHADKIVGNEFGGVWELQRSEDRSLEIEVD